jgi:flagellar biosynthetic protein FliR
MIAALKDVLPADVMVFALVFSRVGTMVMVLPALGEANVPPRARLALALALTLVMAPVVGNAYPPAAAGTVLSTTGLIVMEIAIGLAVGLIVRMMLGAVQVAGNVIATQTGLAFSQIFDANQGTQSALVSMFLSLLAITLIFASDLHHLLIAGIEHSFALFPPGRLPPVADFMTLAIETVSGLFATGLQMSAPFLVFGLIVYAAAGVIARMMPQLQVFFIAMPLNILAGFVILGLCLSTMMFWFLEAFATQAQLFAPH